MSKSICIKQIFLQNYAFVILILLILLTLSINIWWIQYDTRPAPSSDENEYMAKTLGFVDRLESSNISFRMIKTLSLHGRPPLYTLMSVPLVFIFGRSMDSCLYLNLFFGIILLIATYNIGRIVKNQQAGLLAAILVAGYPPLVHISRLFRPLYATVTCVAITMWLLLLLIKTRSIKYSWLVNLSLVFGMVIHPSFLMGGIMIVVILIYAWIILFNEKPTRIAHIRELPKWLLKKLRQPLFLRGILPSGLIAIGLISAWYLSQSWYLLDTLIQYYSEEAGQIRGAAKIILWLTGNSYPTFFWYAYTSPQAISLVLTVLFVISLFWAIMKRQLYSLILAITFLIFYVISSMRVTLGWRYFAQVLPVVAALTGVWISGIKHKLGSLLLTTLCVGISIFNFSVITWGLNSSIEPLARALGADTEAIRCQPENAYFCPNPPDNKYLPYKDVIQSLLSDPKCKAGDCELFVVTTKLYFQNYGFRYYLSKDFPKYRLKVTFTGGRQIQPLNIPSILYSDYIVYEDISLGASIEYVNATINFLRSPTPLFYFSHKEVGEYKLPNESTIKLIKRVKGLTPEEAEEVVAAVRLPEKYKTMGFRMLISLFKEESDLIQRLLLFQKTLETITDPNILVDYLINIAETYIGLEQVDNVISEYQKILTIQADNKLAHNQLAKIFLTRGDCEQAIPHLLKLIDIEPVAARYTILGNANLGCGKVKAAINAYDKALELSPEDPAAHYGLTLAYISLHQNDEARDEPVKIILHRPKLNIATVVNDWINKNNLKIRVDNLINIADTYTELGQVDAAIIVYQKILVIQPNNLIAHRLLAKIFHSRGDCKRAITQWSKLIDIEPTVERYEYLGDSNRMCGEYGAAINAYKKALTFLPKDPKAHYGLALSFVSLDHIEVAREEFKKIILYTPRSNYARLAMNWLDNRYPEIKVAELIKTANTCMDSNRVNEAIVMYQKILDIQPNNWIAHHRLAGIFQSRRDCKQAIPHWLKLIEIQPAAPWYINLGNANRTCQKFEGAITAYQIALTLSPEDPRARYGLALSYVSLHRIEEARKEFEKIIIITPESDFARLAKIWLESHK